MRLRDQGLADGSNAPARAHAFQGAAFRGARCVALLALAATATLAAPALAQDAIYHNGRIVTLDGRMTIAEAVAVKDGRIVAVGSNAAVRALGTPSTRQIDLGGKTMIPGFYDNHVHLGGTLHEWKGGMIGDISDWLLHVETVPQLEAALRARATRVTKGEWIRGSIPREIWPNQKVPTRWDLDRAAPDHPVALARGPHTLLLNSRALALAGITRETPNPEGGWIFRDSTGEPNGRVLEAARRLVERVAPRELRGGANPEAQIDRNRRFLLQLAELGITSVNITGVSPADMRNIQQLYDRHGAALPRATVQIRLSPGHDSYDDMERGVKEQIALLEGIAGRTGLGNDRLKLGAIKMSIDGGLSAPVFWAMEDYEGRPGFRGAQRIPDDVFYRVAKRAHELGWQLGIHAMGDAAAVMVVEQIARILQELPRNDHRHYLHHVAVRPPDSTIAKMARHQMLLASQPGFTVGLGAFADEALTPSREATQNPVRSLTSKGVRVSFGSDGGPFGPMVALYAAVTRRGWNDQVHGADEGVSVLDALRMHTLESAYLTFDERSRGTIEVGKVADFAVLSDDILAIDALRLRDVRVLRTVVGGMDVYVRP